MRQEGHYITRLHAIFIPRQPRRCFAGVLRGTSNTPAFMNVILKNNYYMEKLTFEQLPEAVTLLLEKVNRIEQLLTGKTNDIQPLKDMLTTKEAAEFMGVSLSTVYKMTHKSEVPVYKPSGKKVYLKRNELVDYMSKNRSMSNDEIEKEAINYVTNNPLKGFRR